MTSSELRKALIELEAARAQGLGLRSRPGIAVAGINLLDNTFWTRPEDGVYYHITAHLLLEWLDALQEWRESSPKATLKQQAKLAAETENPFEPIFNRLSLLEEQLSRIERDLNELNERGGENIWQNSERLTKLEDLINRKLAESMTARHGARIEAIEDFVKEKFKDFK